MAVVVVAVVGVGGRGGRGGGKSEAEVNKTDQIIYYHHQAHLNNVRVFLTYAVVCAFFSANNSVYYAY